MKKELKEPEKFGRLCGLELETRCCQKEARKIPRHEEIETGS